MAATRAKKLWMRLHPDTGASLGAVSHVFWGPSKDVAPAGPRLTTARGHLASAGGTASVLPFPPCGPQPAEGVASGSAAASIVSNRELHVAALEWAWRQLKHAARVLTGTEAVCMQEPQRPVALQRRSAPAPAEAQAKRLAATAKRALRKPMVKPVDYRGQ